MTTAERMVLLTVELGENNTLASSTLQLVGRAVETRYGLGITSPEKLNQMLRSMCSRLLLEKGPLGYRLSDGGRAELEQIHLRLAPFCHKFQLVAAPIIRRAIPTRSPSPYANLRVPMHREGVPAQVRNHREDGYGQAALPEVWQVGQAGTGSGATLSL